MKTTMRAMADVQTEMSTGPRIEPWETRQVQKRTENEKKLSQTHEY